MTNGLEIASPQSSELGEAWYRVDERGLRANRVPSWGEWTQGLKPLKVLHHALPMIIGDYINVGEDTFGEKFEQALDIFGEYSYGTVANYASICRSVPYERRAEGLVMAHYKAIRSLTPEEQIDWQKKAIKNNWTSVELWDNIHDSVPTFPLIIDEVIEVLAGLYSMSNDAGVDEELGLAQQHLQEAKVIYERQAQDLEDDPPIFPQGS